MPIYYAKGAFKLTNAIQSLIKNNESFLISGGVKMNNFSKLFLNLFFIIFLSLLFSSNYFSAQAVNLKSLKNSEQSKSSNPEVTKDTYFKAREYNIIHGSYPKNFNRNIDFKVFLENEYHVKFSDREFFGGLIDWIHNTLNGIDSLYSAIYFDSSLESEANKKLGFCLTTLEGEISFYEMDGQQKKIMNFLEEYNQFSESIYAQKKELVARKKEKRKEHIKSIRNGQKPVKTLDDAIIYYNAKEGGAIVENPPLESDKKYYKVSGNLYSKQGKYYILELQSSKQGYYYFSFTLSDEIAVPNLRIKKEVTIVGKFIDVQSYKTTTGQPGYMPLFEAKFVHM
jgi:hypothetical protein